VTRALASAPLALLGFVAALALAASTTRSGLVPDEAVALWAGATAAASGEISVGGIVAAYPPLPFLSTTLVKFLAPAGAPAPALLGAAVVGLIAGLWFARLADAGLAAPLAGAAALLLALHPAVLRAAAAGPADMLVVLFLYLAGAALYGLRARSGVPEAMAVGLALLGLSFSHPMGAAITAGAIPFLALAIRPALVAGSALNVVLTLIFPTLFSALAFAYVSFVFPGDGWRFFTPPSESLSAWAAGLAHGLPGSISGVHALDGAIAVALALIVGAPVVPLVLAWVRRRTPLTTPALVLAAAVVTAAILTITTQLAGSPAILTVAGPVLAALVLTRVPIERSRHPAVALALVLGWLGGAASLVIVDPRIAVQAGALMAGSANDRELADALALGGATARYQNILVDSPNAPAIIIGRGDARGLLSPSSDAFRLAELFPRLEASLVAIPDPDSRTGAQDRLNKSFPRLFHNGDKSYRIVYQNSTWRLFALKEASGVYKD
jgi:hypothetical protein